MKKVNINFSIVMVISLLLSVFSCTENVSNKSDLQLEADRLKSEKVFTETVKKHLNAVSNKDIATLKSTMSPQGKMQLILPGSEIINSVDGFMKYHEDWFRDTTTTWTFETKILNTEVGDKIGMAITEIIYREPERNGVPYFNRMIVSYVLEKINDEWYFIKDHASSVEKSTDKK